MPSVNADTKNDRGFQRVQMSDVVQIHDRVSRGMAATPALKSEFAEALFLAYETLSQDRTAELPSKYDYATVLYESSDRQDVILVGFHSANAPVTPRVDGKVTLGCDMDPGFVVDLVTHKVTKAKPIC